MKKAKAVAAALKHANDFSIQHAGVTRDYCIVTTLECVRYQKSRDNLLLYIDGNWRWEKKGNDWTGWVQREPQYHWFPKKFARRQSLKIINDLL